MPAAPTTQVRTFHLNAPVARVFPLFTAQGERAWAPGWEPRILSGSEERGSAFITSTRDGATVTWIVTDYRPAEGRVSYARLVQDSNIGIVDVACAEAADGGTDEMEIGSPGGRHRGGVEFCPAGFEGGKLGLLVEHGGGRP